MGLKRTDEFRQDAVRIALTSGLTRKQVAVLSDEFEPVSVYRQMPEPIRNKADATR